MKLQTFFQKFEHFARTPTGVRKLRELVLELAVQGRLIAQNPADEPAALQLGRIAARKSTTGRVARTNSRAEALRGPTASTKSVPPGWARVPLADLVTVLNGRAYAKTELLSAGTPVLRVGNLFTSNHWYYSDLELEPDKYCDKGDLLFAWSASFGPFIWPGPRAIYHYHIWKLELFSEADLEKAYVYWFLQNKTQEIKRAGHGVSMLHMTKEKMEKLEVALPPVAEQRRIVTKLQDLMMLCDRLEAAQQERELRQAALSRASLDRFGAAPTPANLDFLFHASYAVEPADLRRSILTLAVQGRLVPQTATDEPGRAVVERIRLDNSRNESKSRLARQDDPPNLPFAVPKGWAISRLGSILSPRRGISYGVIKLGPEPKEGGVSILRCSNVRFRRIDLRGVRKISEELSAEYQRTVLQGGELLINVRGTLGGCAVVPARLRGFNIAREVAVVPVHPELNPSFLLTVVAAPFFQDQVVGSLRGIAYAGLNLGLLRDFPVPIPPLAEQSRIVAKVEQLMALVDNLEAQLVSSVLVGERLTEAMAAELIALD